MGLDRVKWLVAGEAFARQAHKKILQWSIKQQTVVKMYLKVVLLFVAQMILYSVLK